MLTRRVLAIFVYGTDVLPEHVTCQMPVDGGLCFHRPRASLPLVPASLNHWLPTHQKQQSQHIISDSAGADEGYARDAGCAVATEREESIH